MGVEVGLSQARAGRIDAKQSWEHVAPGGGRDRGALMPV